MENNKPKSESLSLQVWETAHWARELSASCREGSRWAAGQRKFLVQQRRASHGQCQERSVWHEAALWWVELSYLSSGLEPASVTPWKWCAPPFWVFDKCLVTPDGMWGICSGAYAWSHSADMVILITCAIMLGVSPCQMCVLWLK